MSKILKRLKSIRLLPPKDKAFYALFDEMVETLALAAGQLTELFESNARDKQVVGVRIETDLTRMARIGESVEELLKTAQQPPFDRSDISQFKDNCFRTMKYINHAANRYVIYDFPSSDKEMRELAPIILEACQEIRKAVNALEKDRNIAPYCRAVEHLETKADEIYHEGLRRRFQEIRSDRTNLESLISAFEGDGTPNELVPIIRNNLQYTRHVAVFFILRQVYEELERAIDCCGEVAADLKRMVAENV